MFPLCVLVMLLCLQRGGLSDVEMVNLQVEFGESAVLPCNGSAYLEDEGSVQWERMGEDVAYLRGGELRQGDKFKGRVQLPSEEKLGEGDWSVILRDAILSDTDMYECILEGRKTISTVWLTVVAPHVERSLVVPEGDMAYLTCYIQVPRSRTAFDNVQVWWTRNGRALRPAVAVSDTEDIPRIEQWGSSKGEFHLSVSPALMSDGGEYRCLYKVRDSDDPRPGIPETVTLTVLEADPTEIVIHPDETTTATGDWVGTSQWPVLLDDPTQPVEVMTEPQPMEAFEETVTSFPDEETWTGSLQWEALPWVRIGLIAGVLLVTAVVLCVLGALRKI